jgi:uncharacterized protein
LLLLGAMLVGWASGEAGRTAMQPFSADIFKGMLAFFLLDMGLLAARNLGGLRGRSPWLLAYAVLGPICHAALALGLCWLLAIPQGDAALLMVLAASASYIAVPAVLRCAGGQPQPVLRAVAGGDLSAEHLAGHSGLHGGGPMGAALRRVPTGRLSPEARG